MSTDNMTAEELREAAMPVPFGQAGPGGAEGPELRPATDRVTVSCNLYHAQGTHQPVGFDLTYYRETETSEQAYTRNITLNAPEPKLVTFAWLGSDVGEIAVQNLAGTNTGPLRLSPEELAAVQRRVVIVVVGGVEFRLRPKQCMFFETVQAHDLQLRLQNFDGTPVDVRVVAVPR